MRPGAFALRLRAPTLAAVAGGLERLEAWALEAGVRFERRRDLLVVYDELATNVAKYATAASELVVSARRLAGGGVAVAFEDDGAAFDPFARAAVAVDLPLAEREPGGLGVHIVRELATRVSYLRRDGRNRVEVELGGPAPGAVLT